MSIATFTATTNAERHAELAGAWILSLPSENTRRAYRRDLLSLFTFLDAGHLDALDAKRKHLDLWRETLTGAASSVARHLSAASSFYSYAVAEEAISANPVVHVTRPRIDADHSSTRGLTKDEARTLLTVAHEDSARSYALVTLLLHTGIRISEALSADLSALQHDTGHRVLVVTRKGGKLAKIALPAQVVDALAAYLGTATAEGSEITTSHGTDSNPPIFTTASGARWAASEAFRTVQRLARLAGVEGRVSPHSLRHTHATLALDAGAALHDLQDSMGHADPRTTRRYDRARGRLEKSSSYIVAAALV
jgi:site-specific recombinase XerD